jgi:hypothetical protein
MLSTQQLRQRVVLEGVALYSAATGKISSFRRSWTRVRWYKHLSLCDFLVYPAAFRRVPRYGDGIILSRSRPHSLPCVLRSYPLLLWLRCVVTCRVHHTLVVIQHPKLLFARPSERTVADQPCVFILDSLSSARRAAPRLSEAQPAAAVKRTAERHSDRDAAVVDLTGAGGPGEHEVASTVTATVSASLVYCRSVVCRK